MSKTTKSSHSTGQGGKVSTSKRHDTTSKPKVPPASTSTKKPTIPSKNLQKPTEEKNKVVKSTSLTKSQVSKPTVVKTIQTKPAAKAPTLTKPSESTNKSRTQPLRAKHSIGTLNSSKPPQQPIAKHNVMNTVHNVTVSSPPPEKREMPMPTEAQNGRERTKTRTLQPEEIVILKQQIVSAPKSLDLPTKQSLSNNVQNDAHSSLDLPEPPVKESVAFEILFDGDQNEDKRKSKEKPRENLIAKSEKNIPKKPAESLRNNTAKVATKEKKEDIEPEDKPNNEAQGMSHSPSSQTEDADYEDDFESYESDFETGSSSSEPPSHNTDEDSQSDSPDLSEPEESSEVSEETQLPITVIHRDDERKLDSGSYDMNSRKLLLQQHQQQLDSIDTSTANSEQLDSGISYSAPNSSLQRSSIEPQPPPIIKKISKRGQELMSKIQFDDVTFVLFDLKPVNYEYYMKIYGNYNSTQMSTQTNDDRLETSIQTDALVTRSIWTQHPPQFDLEFMRANDFRNLNNACGEFESDSLNINNIEDPLSRSLSAMSRFRSARIRSAPKSSQTDFIQLNDFLHRTEFTLASILNKPSVRKNLHNSNITITQGYYNLNSRFLSATRVTKLYSNPRSNLLVIVHDDVESVYSGDFRNLLSVWNITEPKNPFKLLSTWSKVCRAEICAELQDVIVAGLEDGSIALWDLKESYSFGVQFGDGSCYFPPIQTITPCLGMEELILSDIGIVIDVRAFRSSHQLSRLQVYRPIQFASLHDSGILTIWTLVNLDDTKWTFLRPNKIDNSKMEYNSPSARFKLTQSAVYNLRDYLSQKMSRPKSSFDKTRSYFENDLFSDNALKELQETNNKPSSDLSGLRFTGFDVGIERIYISTNRDFIISCTKTLKPEKFRKIVFENSKGLFATALKLLWSEEYLIVGFSNGSVVVYNCNQQKPQKYENGPSEDNSACPTPLGEPNKTYQADTGKSCAIQNIVRNERTPYEDRPDSCMTNTRPTTALDGSSKTHASKLFDKQVLLGGTVLRKDLVNTIEVTNDGNRLLALMDGNLRIYDFSTNSEVHCNTSETIVEIGLTKETFCRQNLALLTKDEDVQVHIVK